MLIRPYQLIMLSVFLPIWSLAALDSTSTASAQPQIVRVGVYINDIHNLDLKTHSFGADLYLWMRWRAPALDPIGSFEIMNPFELWALSRTLTYEEPVKLPDQELYQVVRLQGSFSEKFDLANYPFDPQGLHIDIEDSRDTDDQVQYVVDSEAITLSPHIKLPGFQIGRPLLTVKPIEYPTKFGDPRHDKLKQNMTYSRLRVEIPIIRPLIPYGIKLLLPVLCVVFCASLMFLFNPTYVDARVGIGITALLTVVALQITLNEDLPEIDYLVLIDKVYLATYLYVIAGLGVVVKTTWMLDKQQSNLRRAIRIDQYCLIGLTLLYTVIVFGLIQHAVGFYQLLFRIS